LSTLSPFASKQGYAINCGLCYVTHTITAPFIYVSIAAQRHTLKIDKSFLVDVAKVGNDNVIARSIIDLGHNLGYKVIAEGVETSYAWELLEGLGCDAVQGHHISHPLTHEGLWLAESQWHERMN
jgi:EAL domain-containing protein (putative c-di-GMP-specific phosphodiesterase class I)